MSQIFITNLVINKVRHLKDISIPLADNQIRHLILTGKNGSGKTSIVEALAGYLNSMLTGGFGQDKRGLDIRFNTNVEDISSLGAEKPYISAYYSADRIFRAEQPRHVEKVQLRDEYELTEFPRYEFVKYLLDLKMTEALARNSRKIEKADEIKRWFEHLDNLLQDIFADRTIHLEFDEETFEFHMIQQGKEPFDFNTLSSGYQAVLDIVVDIMMRMQKRTGRSFHFNLPGIVLVDEIETHLHLELQKNIMPLLTSIFPNIQFIVTTHSPFILNSLKDVVIYDLENHLLVEGGLEDVLYDGIVEGYFGADKLSYTLKDKFEQYKNLVRKESLSDDEICEIAELEMYLDEIPDYLAIGVAAEYRRLKLDFMNREDIDG